MSLAKITLIGFYNYDNTLFDNITLPSGIDKDTLVNNILLDGGEFEVLYGNPIFYKNAVEHFFKLNYDLFNRWVNDLSREYQPLENYDRQETWSDSGSYTNDGTASTTSQDTSSGTTSTTNQVSSFDASSNLVDDTKSDGTASNTASGSNSSATHDSNTHTDRHDGRVHGNIGVTTSQQMLESELEIRQKWQLIKIITDMFINELLIAVYE